MTSVFFKRKHYKHYFLETKLYHSRTHSKYTKQQAASLGLKGWCKNTPQGTVTGSLEGPSENVSSISQVHFPAKELARNFAGMDWLRSKGSPSSKIDKAEFKNDKEITQYTYENFNIVKD